MKHKWVNCEECESHVTWSAEGKLRAAGRETAGREAAVSLDPAAGPLPRPLNGQDLRLGGPLP